MTIWDITTTNYWQDSTAPGAIVLNAAPGGYTAPSDEEIEGMQEEENENESSSESGTETPKQDGDAGGEGEHWESDTTQWFYGLQASGVRGEERL